MGFIKAETFNLDKEYPYLPRGKIYVHESERDKFLDDREIPEYLLESFKNANFITSGFDFFNSIFWGNSIYKIAGFFGYTGLKENPSSEPVVHSWRIKNGLWEKENPITYSGGLILLGEEEKLRRNSKNLDEYLSKTLDLNILNAML